MIHIDRLPKPQILVNKEAQWQARFLEKKAKEAKARPYSSQYAHPQIRSTLETMSYRKCFYCEAKLTTNEAEVDHYIEVAEFPEQAFEWENLYLSCHDCNSKKQPNISIPVTDCIDPCGHDNPANHLRFTHEIITAKDNSTIGLKTIQKYDLTRDGLNYERLKALQRFNEVLIRLLERSKNGPLTLEEKGILLHFQQPDRPFSLMFETYLRDRPF